MNESPKWNHHVPPSTTGRIRGSNLKSKPIKIRVNQRSDLQAPPECNKYLTMQHNKWIKCEEDGTAMDNVTKCDEIQQHDESWSYACPCPLPVRLHSPSHSFMLGHVFSQVLRLHAAHVYRANMKLVPGDRDCWLVVCLAFTLILILLVWGHEGFA